MFETREAFEKHFRDYLRPYIGDDADQYSEADFVSDLAEDGWPDSAKWLEIWYSLHTTGRALTPREREQAMAYHVAGEDWPAHDLRL
jgi:hypothetical protein